MRVQVSCINKREHHNPHERIVNIGGIHNGQRWLLSETEAIKQIESRTNSFFVSVNYREVDVIIAIHLGRKYLKTTADGYAPNNLLSLNECSIQ